MNAGRALGRPDQRGPGCRDSVEVRPEAMHRYLEALAASLADTVWSDGCDSYFRTAAGDIVTQLPHSAGWYCERTRAVDLDDVALTAIAPS